MRKWYLGLLVLSLSAWFVTDAASQPPDEGKKKDFKQGKIVKGKEGKEGKGGFPPKDGLPLLPPFVRDQLDLSDQQVKQLAELEREFRDRLMKMLTAEQRRILQEIRPKGSGEPKDRKKGPDGKDGKKGPDGKDGKKGPPDGKDFELGPPPKEEMSNKGPANGIQCYTSLESGLKEAQRTGKLIMSLSAAPRCGGVSGV